MPNNFPTYADLHTLFEAIGQKIDSSGGDITSIATTTTVGTVKPDNNTITVDEDGTISANKNIDVLSADPANPVSGQIWITVSSA